MRLRQIALIANELEPVVDHLRAVLGLEVCFRDPGVAEFGLHNALLPIGTSFLEVDDGRHLLGVRPARSQSPAQRGT